MQDGFSHRLGYRSPKKEITVREDAPEDLRYAIPQIAKDVGITPEPMRRIICSVLRVAPDPMNWSEYPNIENEVNELISECPWFRVYDIAEVVHADLMLSAPEQAESFEMQLNDVFFEKGVGWQMSDGRIVYRGSDTFAESTRQADEILADSGYFAASEEIREALHDISRRPEPDVTGAIQHAMSALECTAREVSGKRNLTLGRIVQYLNLTPPLDVAVEKLWGYASERGRHIREGQSVSNQEAELVVTLACSLCTFIARRYVMDD